MLDAEGLPGVCVSKAEFTLGVDADHTSLLTILVNDHGHCGSQSNAFDLEGIYALCYFYAKTLFDAFVVQNSPEVDPIFQIYGCIQVPAWNFFENDFLMLLKLLESVANFEVVDFGEVENL